MYMDIRRYFNNIVMYEKFSGEMSEIGNTLIYDIPIEIKARLEGKKTFFRPADGDSGSMTISNETIMTDTIIGVKDKINGQIVQSVSYFRDMRGNIMYCEAYL